MIHLLLRILPVTEVAAVLVGVAALQLAGIDVLGMAWDFLTSLVSLDSLLTAVTTGLAAPAQG